MNWFKVLNRVYSVDKTEFDVPVEAQRKYLNMLGEARDDIERSFKQYKCQAYFMPKWKVALQNIISFFFFIPCMVWFTILRLCTSKKIKVDAIGEFCGIEEIIPDVLSKEYAINNDIWSYKKSLSLNDSFLLLLVFLRTLNHPFFSLKCLFKTAMYSNMIRLYNPKAIIVHNEYSFTSSFLTDYCHKKGVLHINVMHGDKYFFIRDSFFRYDLCYVWDEFYINLFRELKAEPNQFIIAVPPSLRIKTELYVNPDTYSDYKYYLEIYSEEELKMIIKSLQFIKSEGKSIKYRPHPRYSNLELLYSLVDKNEIEDPNDVGILESISNMETAIGSCTTVLLQSYFSRKKVILDNVTFKRQYNHLFDLGYMLNFKSLPLLSDFQNDDNTNN